MKLSIATLLTVIGLTYANRPSLSINVQDGSFADVGGLDPSLSWCSSTAAGDINLDYGVEAAARPTTDLASLPKQIWGKASGRVSGWGVSARAEFQGTDFTSADVDIDASNDDLDLDVNLKASAGDGFSVNSISAVKGLDVDGARVTVNPRYDVAKEESDVVLSYKKAGTELELTASQDAQSLKLSRQLDDDNRVAPTLASSGDVSLEWERSLGDDNSITTTFKPDDSINVEWNDSSWTANINMPLDGTDITGTNVSIKREVNF